MKHKKEQKEKEEKLTKAKAEPVDFNKLLETLIQQKDELFEDTFLTEENKHLIDKLPDEYKKQVRKALLDKAALFKLLREKLQRASADYANFQKRIPKQMAETISYEKEAIIKTLLPALDNFEHTLQNASSTDSIDVLIKGIQILYDQILGILKSHNVEKIKAAGEKFDPALHQAMMQRYEPDKEDNIVLEEFQRGYKLNGKVIRPSKVIVNKLPSEQAEVSAEQQKEQEQTTENEQPTKTDSEQ